MRVKSEDELKMVQRIYDKNSIDNELMENNTRNYADNGDYFWKLIIRFEVVDTEIRESMLNSHKQNDDMYDVEVSGNWMVFKWKEKSLISIIITNFWKMSENFVYAKVEIDVNLDHPQKNAKSSWLI